MRKSSSRLFYSVVIIGLLAAWYWVELSPVGSRALALCNGGYGTFDMKIYNVADVLNVLRMMTPEGFSISLRYYIGDFLLIVFFGLLQFKVTHDINNIDSSRCRRLRFLSITSMFAIVLRGLADILENTVILRSLFAFPQVSTTEIEIASVATKVKFALILLWVLLVLAGLLLRFVCRKENERPGGGKEVSNGA